MTDAPATPMTPQQALRFLFQLLDDIDTLDDVAKTNDEYYRAQVRKVVARRWETGIATDGYVLDLSAVEANAQTEAKALRDSIRREHNCTNTTHAAQNYRCPACRILVRLRDAIPEIDLKLTVEPVESKPRKLRTTIDTRSPCGWLQQMTHGFAMWECERKNHGMNAMLPRALGGWGYYACPEHAEGGSKRAEAEAGLAKLRTA